MRALTSASLSWGNGAMGVPGLPALIEVLRASSVLPFQYSGAVKLVGLGFSATAAGPLR